MEFAGLIRDGVRVGELDNRAAVDMRKDKNSAVAYAVRRSIVMARSQ